METPPPLKTVLVVDDADTCRLTTKWFLESMGYTVHTSRSAEEALARFDPATHHIVITDNSMPGLHGASMARIIKQQSPATPIVMFSRMPPDDCGFIDLVIRKPAHLLRLKEGVDKLMRQVMELRNLTQPTEPIHEPASQPSPAQKPSACLDVQNPSVIDPTTKRI